MNELRFSKLYGNLQGDRKRFVLDTEKHPGIEGDFEVMRGIQSNRVQRDKCLESRRGYK